MPGRKSGSSTKATPTPAKTHKRQLSGNPATATETPGSRSSKRLNASASARNSTGSKITPTKSKYFEDPDSDEGEKPETADEVDNSGYEDEDASETEEPSSSEELESEDDYDSGDAGAKKRRGAGRKKASGGGARSKAVTTMSKLDAGTELWRPGVKTGLGPGKEVFIEKPKPRGDGGVRYVPDKIHPNTMAFLKDLKTNNDREWLKMHDPDYRQSWKDWESFVETLTEKISELDETVPELPPKDLVFRIYRDIRFSSDPTPYKPHFSAAWSRTGRKGPYAHYYVQIQPGGKSFVGAGLWMPEAQPLALIRTAIDRRPKKLRRILTDPRMRKHILGGIPNDEKKAIEAFAAQNSENALKTKPKSARVSPPLNGSLGFMGSTKSVQAAAILLRSAVQLAPAACTLLGFP
ncbi:hypothetical protein A1O1_08708 [Capronia coronata CBS 617.96]|uniref:TIGR02453 family protein n=1 Tax=Capronia coronata CBS 617.96 TaxID=1182541 RepID=W9XJ66_9EURO|nr:uncharacterized protein A1O1_08708 [Capronia coronata CBS 617.96]EXJ80562.1 hypothetical protein A1O1_08708 [Capronia coronata CBS 617.96]